MRSEDRTAGEIAGHFLIARSTLSGHFNVLKDAGLVVTERRGTTIVYSLNVSVYEETVAMVMEVLGVREGFLPKGESRSRDDDAYEPAE